VITLKQPQARTGTQPRELVKRLQSNYPKKNNNLKFPQLNISVYFQHSKRSKAIRGVRRYFFFPLAVKLFTKPIHSVSELEDCDRQFGGVNFCCRAKF
jgi:hypothetical protein